MQSSKKHYTLLVVQLSTLCNLNCSYCYVPDRRNAAVMSLHTWRRILQLTVGDRRNIGHTFDFLFHAGEPLAIGTKMFGLFVDECVKAATAGVRYTFSVQTNGTLINEEWISLFHKYRISVGVSIDGPKYINDISRINWSGRSTLDRSLRGIRMLQESGHPDIGCLAVVGIESLRNPIRVIEFFDHIGVSSVGFNIEDIDGVNFGTSFGDNREERRAEVRAQLVDPFYSALFDYWWPIRSRFTVREFADVLRSASLLKNNATYVRQPDITRKLGIITFKRDGAITSFAPEFASAVAPEFNNFDLAHVDDIGSLSDIGETRWFKILSEQVRSGIDACKKSCAYFPICGGAHISNRYFEYGDLSRPDTFTCEMMLQAAADICFEKLISLPSSSRY